MLHYNPQPHSHAPVNFRPRGVRGGVRVVVGGQAREGTLDKPDFPVFDSPPPGTHCLSDIAQHILNSPAVCADLWSNYHLSGKDGLV